MKKLIFLFVLGTVLSCNSIKTQSKTSDKDIISSKATSEVKSLPSNSGLCEVKLHSLFADHMVLQRNKPIKIWGQAPKGETIVAELNGQKKVGVVGPGRTFSIEFPAMEAGGPYILKVNNEQINDLYLGEVWLAGGQSNMEWSLKNCDSYEEELGAEVFPNVRMIKLPHIVSNVPLDTLPELEWNVATAESISQMSGVAYHFSKVLNEELAVPIGIIDNSWGGTDIEGWMSLSSLEKFPTQYSKAIAFRDSDFDLKKSQKTVEEWSQGLEIADQGMKEKWYNERLFKDWESIEVPGKWEEQGHENLDGIVWLASSFTLDQLPEQNSEVSVSLAAIDDSDITFLNGVEIGRITNGWNTDRVYSFDARMLRKENFIHVRVRDDGYGGGIWGEKEKVHININGEYQSLAGEWKMKEGTADYMERPKTASFNGIPTNRYNAMVHPLINYPIAGVIWYQGETNAETKESAERYGDCFKSMITSYRVEWNDELSFCFVQLANYLEEMEPGYSHWGEIRDGQDGALILNKTGMATAIDLGKADDIHPRNKKTVGERLANAAMSIEYGRKIDYKNLRYKSHKITGNKVEIFLQNTGDGVISKGDLTTFHVLDKTGKYRDVEAKWNDDRIIVDVKDIDWSILYHGWMINPGKIALYNSYGLPLVPFKIIK